MEIAAKLRDAVSMFWQALDERERKVLLGAAVYVGLGVTAELGKRSRVRTVARVKQEIMEELAHARG